MDKELIDKIHNNEDLHEDLWKVISELQLEKIEITESKIMTPSGKIIDTGEESVVIYHRPINHKLMEEIGKNDIYNFNVRFKWDDRHQAYALYEGL